MLHPRCGKLSSVTLLALSLFLPAWGKTVLAQTSPVRYINPPSLVKPTGYTHVIVAPDGRTVYIAGQVAFDSTGQVVGPGDFRVQLEQVYGNLRRALASVGGSLADLVKTTTYIADLTQIGAVREIRARYLDADHPPANTLLPVASLARPELLVEIEAIAILPAPYRP